MLLSIPRVVLALLCTWGVLLSLAGDLSAQEPVRSDSRLPPGVLVYGSTPDLPTSYEAFKNTSYGQLINGPELEEFRVQLLEKFHEEVGEKIAKAETDLGLPISDVVSLMAGDASLAIVRPIGQPLGMVAFWEFGDHRDILDQLLTIATKNLSEETPLEKSQGEYAGTELTIYSLPTQHPDYQTVDITYFIKDGQFVLASSRTLAESILDRWDGKHDATFAQDEFYSAIRQQCATTDGSTPDMIWFVNPISLTTSGLELVPQAKPFVNLVPLYLPMLGLNRLKASGATMEVDTEDFNILSKTMTYVDRPAGGLLKLFELRPTVGKVASWVPANATQYMALDWNLRGAYEAVEAVYDGFMGPGKFDTQVTNLTRQANQNNLHIKRDILDVLSGRMEGYMVQIAGAEEFDLQLAAAIGVTDEVKAWKLVEAACESAGSFKDQIIRGTRFITILTPSDEEVAITVNDQRILLASGMETLQKVLEGDADGESLAESAEYKRALAHLPEKVSMISYQSPAAQLKDAYEKLRRGEFDAATEGDFDFSVLPPFEKIEKYLVPTFGYILPVENGAYSVQFGLKPAK